MKMQAPRNGVHRESGGVLVMTLVMCSVLGLALGGYMVWASQHCNLVKRSQAWNQAIPVLEAGIDEALSHLRDVPVISERGSKNGWTNAGTAVAAKGRRIGTDAEFYVKIDSSVEQPPSLGPVIFSEGRVKAPLHSDGYIIRKVRVTTVPRPLIPCAIGVKNGIDMNGNNILIDSFDSTNALYSTGGHYDPLKRKDGGNVTSNDGIRDAFKVGNANIYGKVSVGAGGQIKVGPEGAVGSIAFVDDPANGGKIQDGWAAYDSNIDFPAIENPGKGVAPAGGVTTNGTSYQYYLVGSATSEPTAYEVSKLTGGAYVVGNAKIIVNDQFSAGSSGKITLAPGATLEVFCYAQDASISGQGIENSGTGLNFKYWGMPTNKKLNFGGGVDFIGIVYAPHADVTLGGSGNPINYQGAMMSKSFTLNGGMNVHYDESLRAFRKVGYVVTSWAEL